MRRKLVAGASRDQDVDESFSLLVWVWVGWWAWRCCTRSRPHISRLTTSCSSLRLVGVGRFLYRFLWTFTRYLCSLTISWGGGGGPRSSSGWLRWLHFARLPSGHSPAGDGTSCVTVRVVMVASWSLVSVGCTCQVAPAVRSHDTKVRVWVASPAFSSLM